MTTFICACVLIMPWMVFPKADMFEFTFIKQVFFMFFCMGLMFFAFKDGICIKPKNKYIAYLVGWVFLTTILSIFMPRQFRLNLVMNNIIVMLAIPATLILFTLAQESWLKIAKALCVSAILVATIGVLQVLGLDIYGNTAVYDRNARLSAFLGNTHFVGTYLALIVPFFANFIKDKRFMAGLVPVIWAIIASKSDMAMATLIVSVLALLWLWYQSNRYVLAVLVAVAVILGSVGAYLGLKEWRLDGISHRAEVWGKSVAEFKNNPIFGQGIGVFHTFHLKDNTPTEWDTAHNDYLEMGIEIGVLGLFLGLLVLVAMFRGWNGSGILDYSYMASFVGLLVLMLGSFPLRNPPMALTALLSFCAIHTRIG